MKRIDEMGELLVEVVKERIFEKNKDKMFPPQGKNVYQDWGDEEEEEEPEPEEHKKDETDFTELIV